MIIALAGYATAGKDTAAQQLVEVHGFTQLRFADPIKAMVAEMLSVPRERLEDPNFKERPYSTDIPVSPRYMLQTLGTEWGRDLIDDDLWVKLCMAKARRMAGDVVISDCRFDNEAQAVREAGGYVIWIDRPEVGPRNAHRSETALNPLLIHGMVLNTGTPRQLGERVWDMVNLLVRSRLGCTTSG